MLSRRADWTIPPNELTRLRESLLAEGRTLTDLTASNPTTAGLDYPLEEIAAALARGAHATYDPQPLGLRSAREAVARELSVDADDIVITASTSEAYSFLFKLLADAGDSVVTATPSYPLLEQLAALEQIRLEHLPMDLHARWEMPVIESLPDRARAILIVNPNNPTGSYVTAPEQESLARLGIPLISDEVFFEYPIAAPQGARRLRSRDALAFSLGGLSKSAGLPHLKLGWIVLHGTSHQKAEARSALELIADNFLSVATPVQHALSDLLAIAPRIRAAVTSRITRNLAHLRDSFPAGSATSVLPVEGGWMAVLRVVRTSTDEELALRLLREEGLIVQPGYFFDFPTDGYLAISLLTAESDFARGLEMLRRRLPS
jgi:alanine-synthesizing transaminase